MQLKRNTSVAEKWETFTSALEPLQSTAVQVRRFQMKELDDVISGLEGEISELEVKFVCVCVCVCVQHLSTRGTYSVHLYLPHTHTHHNFLYCVCAFSPVQEAFNWEPGKRKVAPYDSSLFQEETDGGLDLSKKLSDIEEQFKSVQVCTTFIDQKIMRTYCTCVSV